MNPEELSLSPPTADKVPASYKQNLRVNGQKVIIQSSNYYTDSGIFMYRHDAGHTAMIVPLDNWLSDQLSVLQKFVVENVRIPADVPQTKEGNYVFKPLFNRESIMVALSKWCKIYKFDEGVGAYERVENFTQFGKGNFSVQIEASHIYIGPHKGGHNFSLSLRIRQIVYSEEKKEDDDTNLLNELLSAEVEINNNNKKAKRGPRKKKTQECRKIAVSVGNNLV